MFLVALAAGRRRSETHAFSCLEAQISEDSVTLFNIPGLLAKNQLPSVLIAPICIYFLKGSDKEPSLCPVRAINIYYSRVKSRRKERKRF